jgi:hypothetical protein
MRWSKILATGTRIGVAYVWILCSVIAGPLSVSAFPETAPTVVHDLWVWKSAAVLEAPRGAERLRDFCKSEGINEIYVSVSARSEASEESQFAHLIALLHRSEIRVEALLSRTDADEPGKHRETLLQHARMIVRFNQKHPAERFDGIHLDVEPQQRPENKGAGNLRFLPGLADAFRAVRTVAERAGMTVNATSRTNSSRAISANARCFSQRCRASL